MTEGIEIKKDPGGKVKYELTEKQEADIKEAFETLDYDRIGFIYTKDLKVRKNILRVENASS